MPQSGPGDIAVINEAASHQLGKSHTFRRSAGHSVVPPGRFRGSVSTFEHVEGNAIVLKLKMEDGQQVTHSQELVVMPEVAKALARALLAALVHMQGDFDDDVPVD